MKVIVSCSGGKDSVASLLWMRNNGYKKFDVVFCDTGWESQITYDYLKYLEKELDFNLITLKSKKIRWNDWYGREEKTVPIYNGEVLHF